MVYLRTEVFVLSYLKERLRFAIGLSKKKLGRRFGFVVRNSTVKVTETPAVVVRIPKGKITVLLISTSRLEVPESLSLPVTFKRPPNLKVPSFPMSIW